jgi:hypothetical protein
MFSIVMPVKNHRRFLREAVVSVLGPASPAMELIVMDGGSFDGSQAELSILSMEFGQRLRWFSSPDRGPAHALNQAVRLTRCDWLGWLNADDLYEDGALERAKAAVLARPELVMAYGQARLVGPSGEAMGAYPVQPPEVPLDTFFSGCFICQPAAVFQRRAFERVGGFDESLKTAFDFDLWLKLFRTFPGRIGFLPHYQARSRLHADTITARRREDVALEGMRVLHTHLGSAPMEWALTHVEERCAQHPFDQSRPHLRSDLLSLADRACAYLEEPACKDLRQRIGTHKAIQLASPSLFVAVHADGWAGPNLELRWADVPPECRWLRLKCQRSHPIQAMLSVSCKPPGSSAAQIQVIQHNGDFDLLIEGDWSGRGALSINSTGAFVPARCEQGSNDTRELAFKVRSATWE